MDKKVESSYMDIPYYDLCPSCGSKMYEQMESRGQGKIEIVIYCFGCGRTEVEK